MYKQRIPGANKVLSRTHCRVRVVLFCALLFVSAVSAGAEELYRYKNTDGVVVISHYIPPELTRNGYSVLSIDGRVLREVARQLTPEEVDERDRQQVESAEAEQLRQEAKRYDRQLMQLYSSTEDVIFARNRKLTSIDELIEQTRANIESLLLQKQRLEERGANLERSGNGMSGEILEHLSIIGKQVQEKKNEIIKRQQEQEQVRKEFGERLRRIKELYGQPGVASSQEVPVS